MRFPRFNKPSTMQKPCITILGNDGHKQLYMESVNGVMLLMFYTQTKVLADRNNLI